MRCDNGIFRTTEKSQGFHGVYAAAGSGRLTASSYCGYETGKRQPDVAKLKQLARILNTTGSFLLETEPVQDTCRPDLGAGNELMASYGRLNERSKKAVDDLVALLLDLQEKSKE